MLHFVCYFFLLQLYLLPVLFYCKQKCKAVASLFSLGDLYSHLVGSYDCFSHTDYELCVCVDVVFFYFAFQWNSQRARSFASKSTHQIVNKMHFAFGSRKTDSQHEKCSCFLAFLPYLLINSITYHRKTCGALYF